MAPRIVPRIDRFAWCLLLFSCSSTGSPSRSCQRALPSHYRTSARADDVLHVAFVASPHGGGALGLRALMLHSVMRQSQRSIEAQLGFCFEITLYKSDDLLKQHLAQQHANRTAADETSRAPALPSAVIFIKTFPKPELVALLSAQCRLLVLDVVDSLHTFVGLRKMRGVLPQDRALARALVLLQTDASVQFLREAQLAMPAVPAVPAAASAMFAVVRHQHTNVENWRVRTPQQAAARPIRRIGILSGAAANEPTRELALSLARRACDIGASLVLINENKLAGRSTSVRTFECDAASRTLVRSAQQAVRAHRISEGVPTSAPRTGGARRRLFGDARDKERGFFSFSSQRRYHDAAWIDTIDLALLSTTEQFEQKHAHNFSQNIFRPHTRMLHWWSHGVPTLFCPFASYVEAAREVGYVTVGPAPELPIVSDAASFARLLHLLVSRPANLEAFSAAGLRGAARFSPERVSVDLLRAVREGVRQYPQHTPNAACATS